MLDVLYIVLCLVCIFLVGAATEFVWVGIITFVGDLFPIKKHKKETKTDD